MGGRLLRPERGAKGGGRGATLGGRTVVVPGLSRAQPGVSVTLGPGAAEPCSKSVTKPSANPHGLPALCPTHNLAAPAWPAGRRGCDPHVALAAAHRDGAGHDGGQEAAVVRGGTKGGRPGLGELPLGRQRQAFCWPCWPHPGNVLHALAPLRAPRLRSASTLSLRTSCTACSTMTTRTSSSCASGENRSQVE